MNNGKLMVLDTNVILHDSSCIYRFQEHDIAIPITVLEELDRFKKGHESVNYHAREFLRALDALSGDKLFNGGVRIGEGQGLIAIKLEKEMHPELQINFAATKADHHILNIAYHLAREETRRQVTLVSKDVNLRMKAKAVGLMAEDFKNDHVKDPGALYAGHRVVEGVSGEAIHKLYNGTASVPADELAPELGLRANEYLVLRNGRQSALACFDGESSEVRRVDRERAASVQPRNAEQTFALNALLNKEIQLVTISGKAGTGKTLLALAAALHQRDDYRQIFMARPVVPLANRDLGYLPGDVHSKLEPYMQPIFDNLGVIQMAGDNLRSWNTNDLLKEEQLVIAPLAYIRGRSLVKIFFIVDEAQNLTPHEVKTIITRAGEGTKIVLTGDIFQIDHPYLDSHSNGLSYLLAKMQGQKLYAHINLEKGERSMLAELASNLL